MYKIIFRMKGILKDMRMKRVLIFMYLIETKECKAIELMVKNSKGKWKIKVNRKSINSKKWLMYMKDKIILRRGLS